MADGIMGNGDTRPSSSVQWEGGSVGWCGLMEAGQMQMAVLEEDWGRRIGCSTEEGGEGEDTGWEEDGYRVPWRRLSGRGG